MSIAKARRLVKILLDFSLISGNIDHFRLHDIVLDNARSCYSPQQAAQAHTALVESLRRARPRDINGWLFADHPLADFQKQHAVFHMRAALGNSLEDGSWQTNDLAIGWLSAGVSGVIDTIPHAAGVVFGVEKTAQLAQDAESRADYWAAAIRWGVVASVEKQLRGIAAPYVQALESQIKVVQLVVVSDDTHSQPSNVERDRLYLRAVTNIIKTWDGTLLPKYIPHLGQLMQQESDGVNVVDEDPALRCLVAFISALPSWYGGDIPGWAAGLANVWRVCNEAVESAAASQKPLILQFATGMCTMFNHLTIMLEQQADAGFDWQELRKVADTTNATYSYSLHHMQIVELGSVDYNVMAFDVWPVVVHYGNLEAALPKFDPIVRDMGRLVDAANPSERHNLLMGAVSLPFVLFCVGRCELAGSFLTETLGLDVSQSDESSLRQIGHHAMYNAAQSLTYVKLLIVLVQRSLSSEQVTKLLSALPPTPHEFAMQSLDLPMETTMPMLNVHSHIAPCALAALVFCKLGMDEKAKAFTDECLLGDQSRGGDTIASTRIFGLMVRGHLHARGPTQGGEAVAGVDAAFDEAATLADRVGLRLYAVFALHAWRQLLRQAQEGKEGGEEVAGGPSERLREVETRWSSLCGKMEGTEEELDALGAEVWRPIGSSAVGA